MSLNSGDVITIPLPSMMCGIFTYIWFIFMVNVGKYTSPMDAYGIIIHPNESMWKNLLLPSFWGQALIFCFFLCCLTRRWIWEWTNHSPRGNLDSKNIMAMHHCSIYIRLAGSNRHISWSYVFMQFTHSNFCSVGRGQGIWRSTKLLFYCGAKNTVAKNREDEQLEHTQVGRLFVCLTVFEIDWTTNPIQNCKYTEYISRFWSWYSMIVVAINNPCPWLVICTSSYVWRICFFFQLVNMTLNLGTVRSIQFLSQ